MTSRDEEPRLDKPRRIDKFHMMTNRGPITLNLPVGRILHVGFGQNGIGLVYLWVEHNVPSSRSTERTFLIFTEKDSIPAGMQYVGTAHDQSFARTWHIYEEVAGQ